MEEPIRGLQPVPERDEDTVSSLSQSSPRRGGSSPKSSPGSNNPFSSSLFRRSGYQRMTPADHTQELAVLEEMRPPHVDDLGISANDQTNQGNLSHRNSIARVPVGSKSSPPDTPRSFNNLLGSPNPSSIASPPLLSPDPRTPLNLDGSNLASPPRIRSSDSKGSKGSKNDVTTTLWDAPDQTSQSLYDEATSIRNNLGRNNGTPALNHTAPSTPGDFDSRTDIPDEEFDDESFHKKFAEPPSYCASRQDIHQQRTSWLSMTIFILSVYSTVMSGVWLVVAILQPRWGHKIASNRAMTPSNGTLVAALLAKTIEMSFVTVFISCLGQVLTRRSFIRKAGGMTLAEMTMRNWVIQPGSLITHFETLPYAAVTVLGALSLTATVAAAFYTTASDAMVSPKLKYGSWENRELTGYIRSSYANAKYVRENCPSLLDFTDTLHADESCMNVQFAGQSYRNLIGFLTTWTKINENGTSKMSNLDERPPGTTLLYDNTTLISSWIETEHGNVTAHYEETSRIINNVTLAVPHPGVYAAATSKKNGILQPDDLAGVGEYSIRAGVVSPTVNVLCVNMMPEELEPLVYTAWPYSKNNKTGVGDQERGRNEWQDDSPTWFEDGEPYWGNRTVVDDIFKWGPEYERRPPVFQLYPWDYELLTNASVYGSDSIYMMGKTEGFANYTLCQLRSWVSPNCSTHFNISGTAGASMRAHCEDSNDKDSYLRSFDGDPGWPKPDRDWKWLAQQWALSMDLNGGAANRNASNARIVTQLALREPKLPSHLPSMAEGLAVFAAALEVISAVDTPFSHSWEYEKPGNVLGEPGAEQRFNASLITQEYTSGHIADWQNIFYVILVLVFGINLFCLFYFIMRSGLVTDFTEPQNLFALAINSPPSAQLNGSCGGGPEKRDLVVPWRVGFARSVNHYFFEEANERPWRGKYKTKPVTTAREYGTTRGSSYKRLSMSKGWL